MTKKKFAIAFALLCFIFASIFHKSLLLNGESLILMVAPEQQRMRATERLVARQNLDALPGLKRALKDPDSEIQEAACHGLMELGHNHPQALRVLFAHGPLEKDPLDGRQRFPFFLRNAVLRHPQESQRSLLKSLDFLRGDRRLAVLKILQWSETSSVDASAFVEVILALLKDRDPETYDPCFAFLSLAPLRQALSQSKFSGGCSPFVDAMLRVLRGPVKDSDLALLSQKLESPKRSEALVTARVLGQVRAPKSVLPFLRGCFRRYAAAPKGKDIVAARRSDERLCRFLDLLGTLKERGEDALPELLRLLETPSDEQSVAMKAAQILPLIDGQGRGLAQLSVKLTQKPINPFVFDAIEAYGQRGAAVFPGLIELYDRLKSPQDKHRVIQVLCRVPAPNSASFLTRIAQEGDGYEQSLAKEALERLKTLRATPK